MNSTSKWLGIVAVAFVAGSFVASPELRAFAANTVGSTDIINESILSEDIKNSQVKASDIATDAVGAAEIQGVTKLMFAHCALTDAEATKNVLPDFLVDIECTISGVSPGDDVIATLNNGVDCFHPTAYPATGEVIISLKNTCGGTNAVGKMSYISLIIFDK